MQKRSIHIFLLLTVMWLCGGCAFGHRYNYHEVVPTVQAEGEATLAVATHDQRPYVLKGTKPQFVGLTRSGAGIPYNVLTQSDRALAEDFNTVVCNALQKRRFQCIPVMVTAAEEANAVRQKLRTATKSAALLFSLYEWKSDTHVGTTLLYNVTLQVLDAQSLVVAEHRIEGSETLGANFWDPVGVAYSTVPQAFKKKLEELLNHPSVLTALHTLNRS